MRFKNIALGVLLLFYYQQVVGVEAALVGLAIAIAVIPTLTRLLDKRMAVMLALACWITAVNTPIVLRLLDVPWYPSNESIWVLWIFLGASMVGALAAPVIGGTLNSMLADVADEHELESGIRREGVLYAVRAFSTKATAAFGTCSAASCCPPSTSPRTRRGVRCHPRPSGTWA